MKDFEKNDNELRGACQVIQMQLDIAAECPSSDYWKIINSILHRILPDIKIYGDSND